MVNTDETTLHHSLFPLTKIEYKLHQRSGPIPVTVITIVLGLT